MNQNNENDLMLKIDSLDRVIHAPARMMIMTFLYVVESGDAVFLMRQTGLTWGNLASHLSKLEDAQYISIEKEFINRKPHTMIHITDMGRKAFREYREQITGIFEDIPE